MSSLSRPLARADLFCADRLLVVRGHGRLSRFKQEESEADEVACVAGRGV